MAKKDEYGLTAKEKEFADLYRGGPVEVRRNAKQCYKKTHPRASDRTAEVEGAKLLRKPKIDSYLQQMTEEVSEKAGITQERLFLEMKRLAIYNIRNLFDGNGNPKPVHELDDDISAAIAGVKVRRERSRGDDDSVITEVIEYKLPTKSATHDQLNKIFGSYEKDNKQKADAFAEFLSNLEPTVGPPSER